MKSEKKYQVLLMILFKILVILTLLLNKKYIKKFDFIKYSLKDFEKINLQYTK